MTWNEFKNAVDADLEEKNISGDTEVWYIDVTFPEENDLRVVDNDIGTGIYINN